MSRTPKPEEVRFVLRVPPDLHAAITARATSQGNSMNGEIVGMLRSLLSTEDGRLAELDAERRAVADEYREVKGRSDHLREKLINLNTLISRHFMASGSTKLTAEEMRESGEKLIEDGQRLIENSGLIEKPTHKK